METYAYKKKFGCFGFGGIPNDESENGLSHCFHVNGNKGDPMILGLENVVKEYRDSLSKVKLWGPTMFHKVLEQVK